MRTNKSTHPTVWDRRRELYCQSVRIPRIKGNLRRRDNRELFERHVPMFRVGYRAYKLCEQYQILDHTPCKGKSAGHTEYLVLVNRLNLVRIILLLVSVLAVVQP